MNCGGPASRLERIEENIVPSKCHVELASLERSEETEPGLAVTKRIAKYFSALLNLETYTGFFFKNSAALLHLSLATCRLPKTDPWRE